MSEFKRCPLLIGHKECKGITSYGKGNYTKPIIYPCIGEECVAYGEDKICAYFKKPVETNEEEQSEN